MSYVDYTLSKLLERVMVSKANTTRKNLTLVSEASVLPNLHECFSNTSNGISVGPISSHVYTVNIFCHCFSYTGNNHTEEKEQMMT